MPLRFTKQDHDRVAAAIARAENGTSGEIYAVFARASADVTPISYAVAMALCIVSGFLAAVLAALAGHAVAAVDLAFGQVVGACLLLALLRFAPRLRRLFVPGFLARMAAARVAREQFLAHNLQSTARRTGVLLFLSEAEHYAEVIADDGIAAQVPPEAWTGIVDTLVRAGRDDSLADGFVEAIAAAGALLAQHFPQDDAGLNEIPDRLVEI